MAPDHEISGVKVDKNLCTSLSSEVLNEDAEEVKHQFKSPMPVKAAKSTNGHSKKLNGIVQPNDGIPIPDIQLYPPGLVSLEWLKVQKVGAGLVNLGNTCFLNTVIQCLTYCPPLANYLLQDDHSVNCKNFEFCMMCELQKHMKQVFQRSGDVIKPECIYQNLKYIADHFQFGRQEDAHEFLRFVIENLWRSSLYNHVEDHELDPASRETTVINHIFGGYNRSQVVCLVCKRKSDKYEHFMDFILDIKHNIPSLEKAVEQFVKPELLEEENAYKCPKCNTHVPAEKTFTIHRAPNVATFQLKRFDYNKNYGKITKHVSYPEKFDLRPFMSEKKGMPLIYRLNAVLVHMGQNCNTGHYYCYIRNSNGYWYLMDDTRVQKVNLHDVLNEQAYVLFYVRSSSPNGIYPKKNGILSVLSSPDGKKFLDERTKEIPNSSSPKSARRILNLNFNKPQTSAEVSSSGTRYSSSKNSFPSNENGLEHDIEHNAPDLPFNRQNGDSTEKSCFQNTTYDNSSSCLRMSNGIGLEDSRKKNSLCNGFSDQANGVDSGPGYPDDSWNNNKRDYVPCTNSSFASQNSSHFDTEKNSLQNGDHMPSRDLNGRAAQGKFSNPYNKNHYNNNVLQNGCGNGSSHYDIHNNINKGRSSSGSQYKGLSPWEAETIPRNREPTENGSVTTCKFYSRHEHFNERHRKGVSSYQGSRRNSNSNTHKNYRNDGYEEQPSDCKKKTFFHNDCISRSVDRNDGHKRFSSDFNRNACGRKFNHTGDHYGYSERWNFCGKDNRSRRYKGTDSPNLNGEMKRGGGEWNHRTYDARFPRRFDSYEKRNYQGKMKHNKHFSSRTFHYSSSFQKYKDFRRSSPYAFGRHYSHRKSF